MTLEVLNPDALPHQCVPWEGAIRKSDGYGYLYVDGVFKLAHRVAWHLEHGEEPPYPDVVIDHICRNRSCINTEHMELVTIGENVRRGFPYRTRDERGRLGGLR